MNDKKFAEDNGITILTDEDDINALIKEVEENLENADTLVEL